MSRLDDALRLPDGLPGAHGSGGGQITCGVLLKYVNFGKGWRHRVFVLRNGVLKYYKIFGMHGISLPLLLDSLRKEGEVVTIGTETGVLESKRTSSASFKEKKSFDDDSAQAEVDLKVATVEESDADYRKFYIHSESKSLRLRAESEDDKHAWLDALRKAKGAAGGVLQPSNSVSQKTLQLASSDRAGRGDPKVQEMLAGVRRQLAAKGASQDIQAYVEDLLLERHTSHSQALASEVQKRRTLLEHVNKLENAKRQLETDLVVEQRIRNRGSERESPASTDDEQDEDDTRISNEDGSEDVFFDCNTDLARLSSTPLASSPRAAQTNEAPSANGGWSNYSQGSVTAEPAQASWQQSNSSSFGTDRAGSAGSARPGEQPQAPPPPRSIPTGQGSQGHFQQQQQQQEQEAQQGHNQEQQGQQAAGDKSWIQEMQPPPPRRDHLPKPKQHEKSVSLWSILKECIGKDLTRVCLPVYFNEPLSVLQKTVEDLEYAELLNKAATFPAHSIQRMLQVAAFAVSGYSGTNNRLMKPFNPLLGETFEFEYPEQNWRGIAEKVVHHPTIVAAHGQGANWTFSGDCELRSKFWGRSIELIPVGLIKLKFDDGDEYTWTKVTSSVNNLIMGKMYIDHTGIMRITNTGAGFLAKIKFKEVGRLSSKDAHQVSAVFERNGQALPETMSGKWDHSLDAHLSDGTTQRIWQPHPPPADPTRYNLTRFAMMLNERTPAGMESKIAPTDCRLRPDQHFTEEGLYDQANAEKQRLEVKQRKARKEAEQGAPIEPRWFIRVPNAVPGEQAAFEYKGGYWEARKQGRWEGCRDIFGPDE